MIHGIQIPYSITLVIQFNHLRLQIIGKILFHNLIDLSVGILEYNFRLGIYGLHIPLVAAQILHPVATVKDNQFRLPDLLRQQGFHIRKIHGKSGSVNGRDLLLYPPMPGKLHLLIIPHTVVFNDDALRLMLLFQLNQPAGNKILFLVNRFKHRAALL